MSYKNTKLKIPAPQWNKKFDIFDSSYSVPDTQEYFEYIIKKHAKMTDNPRIIIYINKHYK